MLDIKRKLEELLAIYSLEEELIDIYVEGPTDKTLIENFIDYKHLNKTVIEIDTVDFSEIKCFEDLDLLSNKDKLIALSRLLSEENIKADVTCIVDRDFDGILFNMQKNYHLLYTDYSCIESYALCRKHIKRILDFAVKNFPFDTDHLIQEIGKVLQSLFIMRMLSKHFGFNYPFPKLDNNCNIDKKEGVCNFNFDNYLNIYININKLRDRKNSIEEFVNDIRKRMQDDIRFNMNGHDFIEILYLYINKIKNTKNFRLENFESAVYLAIQPHQLEDYELFKKIASA